MSQEQRFAFHITCLLVMHTTWFFSSLFLYLLYYLLKCILHVDAMMLMLLIGWFCFSDYRSTSFEG